MYKIPDRLLELISLLGFTQALKQYNAEVEELNSKGIKELKVLLLNHLN